MNGCLLNTLSLIKEQYLMNLLAHAYLSFNDPEVLVGNMISDYVKGRKKLDYSAGIQKGIMLHRAIDEFTDNHPATSKAKTFFKPAYRLYSGAFVDVVYDHFLANDGNEFETATALDQFANQTYQSLFKYQDIMPEKFAGMLPHMQQQNWLYHYRFKGGTAKSFGGLVRRAAYLNDADAAFEIFVENYDELQQCYNQFFPSLKSFTRNRYYG